MENVTGNSLKKLRNKHRYSQLQLALEIGVSSKHISFIETGRSLPSKAMILKICHFLFMPKRDINSILYSAGYAPIYTELSLSDESVKPVLDAVEKMVENHMPYPAIVLNQSWDVVIANESAQNLLVFLGYSEHTNIIEALISDNPKVSKIINWHETVNSVLNRLKHEISMQSNPVRLLKYERELSKSILANQDDLNTETEKIVLSTKIDVNGSHLSFFSIFAQLGTVQDVTLSEYKVELMFPVDEATKNYYS